MAGEQDQHHHRRHHLVNNYPIAEPANSTVPSSIVFPSAVLNRVMRHVRGKVSVSGVQGVTVVMEIQHSTVQ